MTDKTGLAGLDGNAELSAELDRLGETSPLAAAAPRGTGLAKFLATGINAETATGDLGGPAWALTTHLIQRLGIWWPPEGFDLLPVMTPWCIRDRSARYDQGPEMWSAPREDGYLRDDNSIIKKLPLPLTVAAPAGHPYAGRKPWRGYTACHIWRELEDGGIGGADQWIYSNMANLVWLPTPIMSLTDHHPRVKALLERTSRHVFAGQGGGAVKSYVDYSLGRLTLTEPDGPVLDTGRLARFDVTRAFISRRLSTIDKFTTGVDEVLAGRPLSRKLVSSRYTAAMPLLDREALTTFRDTLSSYASAVRVGLRARQGPAGDEGPAAAGKPNGA